MQMGRRIFHEPKDTNLHTIETQTAQPRGHTPRERDSDMNEDFANIVDYEATDNRMNFLTTDTQWGTRFDHADSSRRKRGRHGWQRGWMSREREDLLMAFIALLLFAASLAMLL